MKMNWKKRIRRCLFPPIAVPLLLAPISAVLLILTFDRFGSSSAVAIGSYLLSFVTLILWCARLPHLVRAIRENRYVNRWKQDVRLRVKLSLYGSFCWNFAYAVFQLALGISHNSTWYYTMAVYYSLLAFMRFFLLRHTTRYTAGEDMRKEWSKYCICGSVLLMMNLALTTVIAYIVFWGKIFLHHEITTIAMATYTFTSFTFSIVGLIRYRKYNSPVYSAAKVIGLICACVSMLTLESTMLTTFETESNDPRFRMIMLGVTGVAVSLLTVSMAVYMIVKGSRNLRTNNHPND